jgi:hypothetical protein
MDRPRMGGCFVAYYYLSFLPDEPDGLCLEARRSARAQWATEFVGSAWISLPGETQSGRRDPRPCLGTGRPP